MPAIFKKSKTQSRAVKVLLRFVWIVSFALAVYGFVMGKSGFAYFLLAALIAAIGAGDISATSGIVQAMRLYMGKEK